jgi:hypothetical protein
MPTNNSNFLKTIFWTLIIGSFGYAWTTNLMATKSFAEHCIENNNQAAQIRQDYTSRDELMTAERNRQLVVLTKENNDKYDELMKTILNFKTEVTGQIAALQSDTKYLRKNGDNKK